jgi:AcrR family transcriptional regulator
MADRARQYRMQRRLDSVHETRERIIRAAFELHRDVGPAQATVKAIAERAGVERHTVQRHFPDLVELIRACTDFGMRTTGLPEPDHWHRLKEPTELLRVALDEMYRYWHRNEQLVANLMRDAATMPELVEGSASYREHLARIWQTVLAPWREDPGQAGTRAAAVAGTALGFTTWRSLTIEQGLSDEDAVHAMAQAVSSVAGSARPI